MRTTASFLRIIGFALFGYIFLNWIGSQRTLSLLDSKPWLWIIYGTIILFYIAGEVSIAALQGVLYKTLKPSAKKKYDKKLAHDKANQFGWIKEKYQMALGSTSLEEEHEIILDHNYDGIKELDNKLPPWWVFGFYGTIAFAIIYLVRFEVFDDYNQAEEYEIAVSEAKIEIEAWKKTAKDLVDATTVTLLTDAEDLKSGSAIFSQRCIACHKSDGGGGIGPNLTDKYWVLGGGIKNVFNTISEGGRSGKGMIAWKTELKPAEIAQVASYVLSLQGSSPAEPKAAEGKLWEDTNTPKAEGKIPEKTQDSIGVYTTASIDNIPNK